MKKSKQKKEKKSGDIKEDKLDCVNVRLKLFFEFISFSFGCSYFFTFFAMYPCTDNIFFFLVYFHQLWVKLFFCVVCYDNTITVATLL